MDISIARRFVEFDAMADIDDAHEKTKDNYSSDPFIRDVKDVVLKHFKKFTFVVEHSVDSETLNDQQVALFLNLGEHAISHLSNEHENRQIHEFLTICIQEHAAKTTTALGL